LLRGFEPTLFRSAQPVAEREVRKKWICPTDWESVCRRNAGRRHYNSVRRSQQELRRLRVAKLLWKYGRHGLWRGLQALLARYLGVSEGTISRDVAALFAAAGEGHGVKVCPLCSCRPRPPRVPARQKDFCKGPPTPADEAKHNPR
jgi:hypothetical protein